MSYNDGKREILVHADKAAPLVVNLRNGGSLIRLRLPPCVMFPEGEPVAFYFARREAGEDGEGVDIYIGDDTDADATLVVWG